MSHTSWEEPWDVAQPCLEGMETPIRLDISPLSIEAPDVRERRMGEITVKKHILTYFNIICYV